MPTYWMILTIPHSVKGKTMETLKTLVVVIEGGESKG